MKDKHFKYHLQVQKSPAPRAVGCRIAQATVEEARGYGQDQATASLDETG
jgi:hypothetical protein